jgi:asparagine synthase (glutamine-hydrolysing)
MCGLAGIFGSLGVERTRESIERMLRVQSHRGPDSNGSWSGTVLGMVVGLGFRRLKILDLSDSANQPMVSQDKRFVFVFNGEIYNYLELRKELAASGVLFRTQGDTEVLMQALMLWGPSALSCLNGMWAFLILDRVTGEVMLSRDRFGVKPLYTYFDERGLVVSSEIKAILEVANRHFQVQTSVANAYLRQGVLCAGSETFFEGIEEFPAGCWATFRIEDVGRKRLEPKRYWTTPTSPATNLSERELIESVRETFIDSVKLRLRSDVPVGVLLSGGLDSSAIAATVHHLDPSRDDIKLISAVGANGHNDEQPFIDVMATYLNRSVEKVVLNYPASEALDFISEASWFNDEPVGSFSTVAHYLLMKRARDLGVTVLLSGQGADEILCGYKKYIGFYIQELLTSGRWLAAARVFGSFFRNDTVLSEVNYREMKRYLPEGLRLPEIDVRGPALLDFNQRIPVGLNGGGVIGRQILDLQRLSVPALVHYEDRMSMAVAREIRLPFLDYRLVSQLVSLPVELKLRSGWTKWIFRKAMEPLLPHAIAWRKDKQNFIVPQNEWFRSELQGDVCKLLNGDWVSERLGLIDRGKFRIRYQAYLRQAANGGRLGIKDIFAPVAVELWARRFERYLSAI